MEYRLNKSETGAYTSIMKSWLLKLIKHKIKVSPITVHDESGNVSHVIWYARKAGHDLEVHGDDPVTVADDLIRQLESNVTDNVA